MTGHITPRSPHRNQQPSPLKDPFKVKVIPLSSSAAAQKIKPSSHLTSQPLKKRSVSRTSIDDNATGLTAAKAAETTKRSVFSNFARSVGGSMGWGVLKTLESIAFSWNDLKTINDVSKKKLQDLTGDDNCEKLLALATPKLVSQLSPMIVKSMEPYLGKEVVNSFVEDKQAFISELAETLVIKMASNLAQAAKEYRYPYDVYKFARDVREGIGEDFPQNESSVSLEDMIGFMFKFASDEYAAIEMDLKALETPPTEEKMKELRLLLAPMAERLLSILLPAGASDLPVAPGVRWGAWSVLKSNIIPDMLIDLMCQARQFQALPGAESLAGRENTQVAALISLKVGDIVRTQGLELIQGNSTSIGSSIIKSFLPDGVVNEDTQLTAWLADQIKSIGNTTNPDLFQALQFAANRSEAVLVYIIEALASLKKNTGDSTVAATKEILESLHVFIKENHRHIKLEKERLEQQNVDPLKDKEYIKLFEPLAGKWQELMHLNSGLEDQSLPPNLLMAMEVIFTGTLPGYLAQYYDEFLVPIDEMYSEEPGKNHLLDVERLKELLSGSDPDKVKEIVQQVENICTFAAEQVCSTAQQYINDMLTDNAPARTDIFSHPQLKELWSSHFQEGVKNSLFKALVTNIGRSAAKTGEEQKAPLLVLEDILEAVLGNLAVNGDEIQTAAAIADPIERQLALNNLFKPMAADLLALLNEDSNEKGLPLPIPPVFAKKIWKELKNTFLPGILAKLCLKGTSLLSLSNIYRTEIQDRLPGSQIPESCHVMARWVCHFMPGYLGKNRRAISEDIFTAVTKHLNEKGNPSGLSVEAYLKENEEQIKQLLCVNILGIPNSETVKKIEMGSEKYIETIFLHVCNGLTRSLHAIEDPESDAHWPDAVLNLAIRLMNVTSRHFTKINKVTSDLNLSSSDQVPYRDMVKGFGTALHKGVPQTETEEGIKGGIEAHEEASRLKKSLEEARISLAQLKKHPKTTPVQIKDQREVIASLEKKLAAAKAIESKERQANFYIPFAKKVMKLAQLEKPQEIPDAQWEMVQKQLVPQFFESVIGNLLEPQTRNQLMITIFDKMDKSLKAPIVLPYQPVAKAMEDFNTLLENFSGASYNKEVYTTARRLYNAMEFASGNPEDKVVSLRLKEMKKVMKVHSKAGTVSREIQDSWSKLLEVKSAYIEEQERKKSAKSPLQRKLDRASGKLVLQLVKSLPHSALRVLFKINKLNKLSGETIGEIVRESLLAQGSLLDIFNLSVSSTVPILTPGKWEGVKGNLHFIPDTPADKFVDLSQDEKEEIELQKIYQARRDAKLVKEKGVAVGNKLLVGSVFNSLETPLRKLKELWDNTVDFVFGKHAPWLRQSIRFLGDKLIFRICAIVLTASVLPIRMLFSAFTELYVSYRTKQLLQFMHLEIFEGLLYTLADTTLETLNASSHERNAQSSFIEELLRAAKLVH